MNLQQYKSISAAMYKELEAVFQKRGFKVARLNAGVDPTYGTVSLSVKLTDTNFKDESGNVTTGEAEFYKKNCTLVQCKPEWLGRSFSIAHRTYKLEGMRNTRSDKCIVVKRDDGKRFVYSGEALAGIFALRERMDNRAAG